jgi:hypothetical protein
MSADPVDASCVGWDIFFVFARLESSIHKARVTNYPLSLSILGSCCVFIFVRLSTTTILYMLMMIVQIVNLTTAMKN